MSKTTRNRSNSSPARSGNRPNSGSDARSRQRRNTVGSSSDRDRSATTTRDRSTSSPTRDTSPPPTSRAESRQRANTDRPRPALSRTEQRQRAQTAGGTSSRDNGSQLRSSQAAASSANSGSSPDTTTKPRLSPAEKEAQVKTLVGDLLNNSDLSIKGWVKDGKKVELNQDAIDKMDPADRERLLADLMHVNQAFKSGQFKLTGDKADDNDLEALNESMGSWLNQLDSTLSKMDTDQLVDLSKYPAPDFATQSTTKSGFMQAVRDGILNKYKLGGTPKLTAVRRPGESDGAAKDTQNQDAAGTTAKSTSSASNAPGTASAKPPLSPAEKEAQVKTLVGDLLNNSDLSIKGWVKDGKKVDLNQDAIDKMDPADRERLLADLMHVNQAFKSGQFKLTGDKADDSDMEALNESMGSWLNQLDSTLSKMDTDQLVDLSKYPAPDFATQSTTKSGFMQAVRDGILNKYKLGGTPKLTAVRRPGESDGTRTDATANNPTSSVPRDIGNQDRDRGEGMFQYMRDAGFGDKVPTEKERAEILKEADRGDKLIDDIISGKKEMAEESAYQHARNIRAISWSLYRKASMKNQNFIGGMMVLEDNGKLNQYLTLGNKKESWFKTLRSDKKDMRDSKGVIYYERDSTHFQERRDMSYGMDFHGFYNDAGEEDRSLKLPVQKSQLHFGTLDGGKRTFIKFEYFGLQTVKDAGLHGVELIKKNIKPEVGHREDVKGSLATAIQKVLKDVGIPKKFHSEIKDGGKKFTLEKSGLHFARMVIDKNISDPGEKAAALNQLHAVLDGRYRLGDKKFVKASEKALKNAGVKKADRTRILNMGKQDKELTPEKWLGAVNDAVTGISPEKKNKLLKDLQVAIDKFVPLTEHPELRQGDEVILTSREIMTAEKRERAQGRWGEIASAVNVAQSKEAGAETDTKMSTTFLKRIIGQRREQVSKLDKDLKEVKAEVNRYVDALIKLSNSDEGTITVTGKDSDKKWTREELANEINRQVDETGRLTKQRKEAQENLKDLEKKLGNPENWMGEQGVQEHLKAFAEQGANTFVTPWHDAKFHDNSKDGFGGWGRDRNFVSPKEDADGILEKALEGDGIVALEDKLGIPPGSWVKNSRTEDGRYVMKRYIIPPDKMGSVDLDMARGREGSAYDDEWVAGGRTLGDGYEATIKTFRGNDLETAIDEGIIQVVEVDMTAQTKRGIPKVIANFDQQISELIEKGKSGSKEVTDLRAKRNELEILQLKDAGTPQNANPLG